MFGLKYAIFGTMLLFLPLLRYVATLATRSKLDIPKKSADWGHQRLSNLKSLQH
jgi:hypothetical protein